MMNTSLKNSKGFTLIEVLASIVLISILLMLVSTYFVNSYQQNKNLSKNFDSIQICQSLLDVYKTKEFSELEKDVGKSLSIDATGIKTELQLDASTKINYSAKITIKKHPSLSNRILVLTVSVSSVDGKNTTSLEGYVRK